MSGSGYDVSAVAGELVGLVGPGLTPTAVLKTQELRRLLGGPDPNPGVVSDRVIQGIRRNIYALSGHFHLFDQPQRPRPAAQVTRALELLLRLVEPGRNHSYRRQRAIDVLTAPYSVRVWRLPGRGEFQLMRLFAEEIVRREATLSRWPYKIVSGESHYVLDARGVAKRIESIRTITAQVPILQELESSLELSHDHRPHVLSLEALFGCEVLSAVPPYPDRSLIRGVLRIPPLREGAASHTLGVVYMSQSDVPTGHAKYAFSNDLDDGFVMRATFDAARRPALVYSFAHVESELLVPTEPTHGARGIAPDEPGGLSYSERFPSVSAFRYYGLSWSWKE